jgi:hypothetical protein
MNHIVSNAQRFSAVTVLITDNVQNVLAIDKDRENVIVQWEHMITVK